MLYWIAITIIIIDLQKTYLWRLKGLLFSKTPMEVIVSRKNFVDSCFFHYYNVVINQSISNRWNNCGASARFHWLLNCKSTAICSVGRLPLSCILSKPKTTKSWLMIRIFSGDVSALKVILKCKSWKSAMILLNVILASFSTITVCREHSHSMTDKSIAVHYSNHEINSNEDV